ncbi:NADH-quinone oxidoreductase subunit M [Modestobacter sp. I12A-02628]|uniref:NADH-quinone oxidoreductase subunit M n=1 Tax=Goekera deserti TaxID=2497753 RepID=A0A7K3WAD9_9ACTN|nr:NADH-quinone oxidoreductase subunit M [Goekera deserti]MPR00568.1 NADH-quinone oxidoreductase subunit M [Goekera deserti]NDI50549.1 NADH-quinone oxidoreductase subunit M [Goekera deserti]NEL52810.1 NADH-quinone oxidoreductase subunit M [Goekera deserti]
MTDFPWLIVMIALPLVGGAVVAALPAGRDPLARGLTLGVSLAVLVLAAGATIAFDTGGDRFQLTTSTPWIESFGVDFALGVDGIALVMLLLIGVLVPVVVVASWDDTSAGRRSMRGYFAWLLVLEAMMVGVFAATDVFLFYVFFEAMLVPMYFIIGSFGGPRRQYAAVKFFLYSLLGGLVMLASVIGLYVVSNSQLGEGTFAFDALRQLEIDTDVQKLLFLGFFLAFAIKAPLFPFHTWLPDSGAEAPIGGGVLLVGVLDKVGTFGFLRYCLPLFPDAARDFAPWILTLAVIGIIYAALLAMGQSDLKRLVTYTSIAHFGFIALGIFAFSTEGGTGAVLYMVNHGISTGLLFLAIGMLIARGGTREISAYGGVAKRAPVLAGVLLIAGLSSLALPGTNSFVSEFLVLIGSFPTRPAFTVVATVGIVLAALYVLLLVQRTMHGPERGLVAEEPGRFHDLDRRELVVAAPLIALVIGLGVYPQPLLDLIDPAVSATMSDIGSDPAGTTPAITEAGAGD